MGDNFYKPTQDEMDLAKPYAPYAVNDLDPQYANQKSGATMSQQPRWAAAGDLARQVGPETLVGGLVTAGQYGLMAAPTAYDRENKAELARLRELQAQGRLGLDEQERQILERQQLSPVRAIAGEQQMRDEALMASTGNLSAATQDAALRRGREAVAEQARRAGLNIAEADLARRREQEREIQDRTAYKAQTQQRNRQFLAQALAGLAEPTATALAGRAVPEVDMTGLVKKFGAEEAWAIRSMVARGQMSVGDANALATQTLLTGGDVGGEGKGPE